jgi:hypothetical protein
MLSLFFACLRGAVVARMPGYVPSGYCRMNENVFGGPSIFSTGREETVKHQLPVVCDMYRPKRES